MLSAEQRREFDERGIAKLERAVDPRVAEILCDEVRALIAKRRLAPEAPRYVLNPSLFASVAKAHGFEEVWGKHVLSAIDELLGAGAWHLPKQSGQILSMPYPLREVTWDVPDKSWHLDYRAPGALHEIPGIQLFLCLDRLESHSGATLVAAGTPGLIDAIRRRAGDSWAGSSLEVRQALRRDVPWFRELNSLRAGEDRSARFMSQASEHAGVSLRVIELVGEPGDVWVMHPWMVHNLSLNCGARPRLVMTERIRSRRALAANGAPLADEREE